MQLFLKSGFFLPRPIEYKWFLSISIWLIDVTWTGITTLGQVSEPRSNGKYSSLSRSPTSPSNTVSCHIQDILSNQWLEQIYILIDSC